MSVSKTVSMQSLKIVSATDVKTNFTNYATRDAKIEKTKIELERLHKSIKENGIIEPLHIDKNSELISGYTRLQEALKLKIPVPVVKHADVDISVIDKTAISLLQLQYNTRVSVDVKKTVKVMRELSDTGMSTALIAEKTGYSTKEVSVNLGIMIDKNTKTFSKSVPKKSFVLYSQKVKLTPALADNPDFVKIFKNPEIKGKELNAAVNKAVNLAKLTALPKIGKFVFTPKIDVLFIEKNSKKMVSQCRDIMQITESRKDELSEIMFKFCDKILVALGDTKKNREEAEIAFCDRKNLLTDKKEKLKKIVK